jgi:hypothetical protein
MRLLTALEEGKPVMPKYPDNSEWYGKDYEKILKQAIKIYKPGVSDLAHKAIEAAQPLESSMAGDDTDYIQYDFVTLDDENEEEAWYHYQETQTGKPIKKLDAEGLVSKQFHKFMKNKGPAAWKAIEAFYRDFNSK